VSSRHRHWLLCGGIGSGKSEVRTLLAESGVHTIYADAIGRQVLIEEGFDPVAERWPAVVLEGEIDRKALARVVFDDPSELAALEAITHPLIFGRIHDDLEGFSGPAVVEMPLIAPDLDWRRLVVDADDEVRMARALARGMDRSDVVRRMTSQPSRGEWLAVADLVIPNHGSREELQQAVMHVEGLLGDV
jgi:dephospho-CoA kinase